MIEEDFKFTYGQIYHCIVCANPIQVDLLEARKEDGTLLRWTELASKYWTPGLEPLCSCRCAVEHNKEVYDDSAGNASEDGS